ncbi:MAG: hypothetical protein ABJD97_18480 [Betaproteobacteria bacterium]
MTSRSLLALPLLAALLALAGCASRASMDARYDASLQHWKGATRADLVAQWGKPFQEAALGGDTLLTWVVHNDFENHQALPTYRAGTSGATVVSGPTSAPEVPITCTTRFVLKGGRVESWTFSGLACGAPE